MIQSLWEKRLRVLDSNVCPGSHHCTVTSKRASGPMGCIQKSVLVCSLGQTTSGVIGSILDPCLPFEIDKPRLCSDCDEESEDPQSYERREAREVKMPFMPSLTFSPKVGPWY